MGFSQVLKRTLKSTIPLVEMLNEDNSKDNSSNTLLKSKSSIRSAAQDIGANTPFIILGDRIITNIEFFTIDETGFIPKITVVFKDDIGEFGGLAFPKRNILISAYVKSSNNNLLPLRGDYLITSIKSMPEKSAPVNRSVSIGVTYIIKGELFIPRLHNNTSKSYKDLVSRDALFKVAEELGLGFVENDFVTNDKMVWINMNTSPLNFIQDVANHAYSTDDSFFESFISKELNLSLIEVSRQLYPEEADTGFLDQADSRLTEMNQQGLANKSEVDDGVTVNHLTTDPKNMVSSNYIIDASLISNQGEILTQNGYKKQIYYYDHILDDEPINKFQDYYMEPINTPGVAASMQLIPEIDGVTEVGHKKWMDINYGNTHSQWNAARLLNTHNNNELKKIQLKVCTRGINKQVVRGMAIDALITQKVGEAIRKGISIDKNVNLEDPRSYPDLELSGKYYVNGAKYYYDATQVESFYTELFLARREWK